MFHSYLLRYLSWRYKHSFHKAKWYSSCVSDSSSNSSEDSPEASFSNGKGHIPVMVDEVIKLLGPKPNQVYLDMTFGSGGHTRALLTSCPRAKMISLDRDPLASLYADAIKKQLPDSSLTFLHGRFSDLPSQSPSVALGQESVDGIVMDLGVSSMQLESTSRGFSLVRDAPLDMRMDTSPENKLTAGQVVNGLHAYDLAQIFKKYGEERSARRIANAIMEYRFAMGPIQSTKELALIVEKALGFSHRRDAIGRQSHVATRIFQSLRIFVNDELNEVCSGLSLAGQLLRPGGVLCAISFHSLEHRLVERYLQGRGKQDKLNWKLLTSECLEPSPGEITANPRSRSAKLRAAQKI